MSALLENRLVIAISSRALFNLEESHRVYETEGLARYVEYQIEHEDDVLQPGVAFPLIKRLLALRYPESDEPAVEVILISRNDANTGLRIFNSIEHYALPITRAAFTSSRSPYQYLPAFQADLFLSADPGDVRLALSHGYAAATILRGLDLTDDETDEIRIAFDGDAVLFSDEAEQIYQQEGLSGFLQHEREKSDQPLGAGPFMPFLEAINRLQKAYQSGARVPIRTALVTARNAPSHKRAIKTLRHWGVQVDEAFFLGGLDKVPTLRQYRPHIFFDDQRHYCDLAAQVVPTGHVPAGVRNKE
ncbi:MAG: 5'-nucleotidase [Bacillota bacterium]|jgi:5'-nucleotidase